MENYLPMRILFLEDVPSDAALAERALRKAGLAFISLSVETRDEFCRALDEFSPDLIISDYALPGFDAMQALALVRAQNATLPFIVLTARDEETAVACMKAGATDYVIKQHMTRLPFAVREALEQQKTRAAQAQAERALRESESKLKTLFEVLPVGISVLDAENRVVYVNPALEAILDMTRDSLLRGDYRVRTYLRPDATPMPAEEFASARARREQHAVHNVEAGVVKDAAGGAVVWVSTSAVPVNYSDWRTVTVTADITDRKRAEEALRENQAKLSAVIENIDGSIWAIDPQYRLIVGNQMFQRNVSAVLGRLLETGESVLLPSFPAAENAEWQNYYDRALRGERFGVETMTRFRSDPDYVEYRFSPILAEHGVIKGATIFGRDITERKRAEEALRQSEERLRQAQRIGHLGYLDWNLAMNAMILSDETLAMYHLTQDRHTRTLDEIIGLVHPADKERVGKSLAAAVAGIAKHDMEHRMVCPDGQEIHIHATAELFRDESGKPIRILGTVLDITARKRAEESLRQTKESLEAANSELQRALAREQQLARTDPLTGIGNRLHFFELAEHEFQVALRYQHPLSIIMLDIDHFKQVNDTFGHTVGDRALMLVARTVQAQLRSSDVLARYGGEEFIVLLPATDAAQTANLAERICERIADIKVTTDLGNAVITVSIGVAPVLPADDSIDRVIQRADEAMYAAKQAGRNRVSIK